MKVVQRDPRRWPANLMIHQVFHTRSLKQADGLIVRIHRCKVFKILMTPDLIFHPFILLLQLFSQVIQPHLDISRQDLVIHPSSYLGILQQRTHQYLLTHLALHIHKVPYIHKQGMVTPPLHLYTRYQATQPR